MPKIHIEQSKALRASPDEPYLRIVRDLRKRQAAVYSVSLLGAENKALPDRARLVALAPELLSRA